MRSVSSKNLQARMP